MKGHAYRYVILDENDTVISEGRVSEYQIDYERSYYRSYDLYAFMPTAMQARVLLFKGIETPRPEVKPTPVPVVAELVTVPVAAGADLDTLGEGLGFFRMAAEDDYAFRNRMLMAVSPIVAARSPKDVIGDLLKALESGNYNAAPTQLHQGSCHAGCPCNTATARTEDACECGATKTYGTKRGDPGHSSWCPWSKE